MTAETKFFAGVLFIVAVTIESGGEFLLRILRGKVPQFQRGGIQYTLFRAGHAHAGIVLTLALFIAIYLEQTAYEPAVRATVRWATFACDLLISGGFFGGALTARDDKPGPLIALTYVGAVVLAACLLATGVGLLRAS